MPLGWEGKLAAGLEAYLCQTHFGSISLPTRQSYPSIDNTKGASLADIGGAEEDRTPDLRIANATLSQLSYRPMSN